MKMLFGHNKWREFFHFSACVYSAAEKVTAFCLLAFYDNEQKRLCKQRDLTLTLKKIIYWKHFW